MNHDPKYDLSGKIALVTGATAFIGRAVALRLAQLGAEVVVNGRNAKSGQQVVRDIEAAGGRAHFAQADITDGEQIEAMVAQVVAKLGNIDILVASGAAASSDSLPFRLFQEMDHADMDHYIRSHWLSRAYTIQAVARHMAANGGGKMVMLGTDAGRVATVGESMIGGATSAMMQMCRSLARELGRKNIRINVVSMSFISDAIPRWGQSSDPLADKTDAQGNKKGMLEGLRKRMIFDVTTADIAEAAAFFASPASDAITGQTLSVNGGLSTPG